MLYNRDGSIPVHTADNERAFFQANLIQTHTRNCLTTENLSKLLTINVIEPAMSLILKSHS